MYSLEFFFSFSLIYCMFKNFIPAVEDHLLVHWFWLPSRGRVRLGSRWLDCWRWRGRNKPTYILIIILHHYSLIFRYQDLWSVNLSLNHSVLSLLTVGLSGGRWIFRDRSWYFCIPTHWFVNSTTLDYLILNRNKSLYLLLNWSKYRLKV